MAEQQLVDYIKKAKQAGQSDDQTRSILFKSGWTEAEVSDAFAALNPPAVQATPPQQEPQPLITGQPQADTQPKVVVQQAKPQFQAQPQIQQKPAIMPAQSTMPKARKAHMAIKLVMVLIILVVLGGAGYFVAGQYINLPYSTILTDFFVPKPATVISKMMANMKNVKSSHTALQIDASATDAANGPQGKISITSEGDSDATDANNPKASFTFSFNVMPGGSAAPLASANVGMRVIGGASYLSLNDLTVNPSIPLKFDISQLKGKWMKIDKNSIAALSSVSGGQTAVPDISQVNSADLTKKIQDLVLATNIFTFNKQLNSEVVSGQSTYHYLVTISKDSVKDLINKIIALETQEAAKLQTQSGGADISSPLVQNIAQAFVKTFTDAMDDIDLEMWIGKKDYMLYQVKMDKKVDLSSLVKNIMGTGAGNVPAMQVEIKLASTSSNFNKPVSIQAPADAQKIEDVVSPMIKLQEINSDMNQIGFSAQSLFLTDKSYASLCQGHALNGNLKGLEGVAGFGDDMVNQGATKPGCFSDAQDYCISTQLADGSFLCIDKSNVLGKVKCTSARTVCNPAPAQ